MFIYTLKTLVVIIYLYIQRVKGFYGGGNRILNTYKTHGFCEYNACSTVSFSTTKSDIRLFPTLNDKNQCIVFSTVFVVDVTTWLWLGLILGGLCGELSTGILSKSSINPENWWSFILPVILLLST